MSEPIERTELTEAIAAFGRGMSSLSRTIVEALTPLARAWGRMHPLTWQDRRRQKRRAHRKDAA
jgi:hypothetical protein